MLYPILALVVGLCLLVWSADKFVAGAAAVARNFGMSPMLVGLTIVSFGTSAPEILVSIMAALSGVGSLAVGNALGSNIANIALVLGATALIAPLPIKSAVLRKEIPLLIGVTLLTGGLMLDFELSQLDGVILLLALIFCLFLFAYFQKNSSSDEALLADVELDDMSTAWALFQLVAGLILLAASSRLLVWGASEIAIFMGVSQLVIGLTIVAIGTSLPELAASVMSALKNHHDIALGNVVGSNIFNLVAVMSIPELFTPLSLNLEVLQRDYSLMLGLTLALPIFALWRKPPAIKRFEGGLLLGIYVTYMAILYIAATN